jgi:hypothetical protein
VNAYDKAASAEVNSALAKGFRNGFQGFALTPSKLFLAWSLQAFGNQLVAMSDLVSSRQAADSDDAAWRRRFEEDR